MNSARIDFAALPWEHPAEGARFKAFTRGGRKLRLVEFTRSFNEQDWCLKGHVGLVLEGVLEIAFPDRLERFTAGDGMFIQGGETERHRARVLGDVVKMILVEDG